MKNYEDILRRKKKEITTTLSKITQDENTMRTFLMRHGFAAFRSFLFYKSLFHAPEKKFSDLSLDIKLLVLFFGILYGNKRIRDRLIANTLNTEDKVLLLTLIQLLKTKDIRLTKESYEKIYRNLPDDRRIKNLINNLNPEEETFKIKHNSSSFSKKNDKKGKKEATIKIEEFLMNPCNYTPTEREIIIGLWNSELLKSGKYYFLNNKKQLKINSICFYAALGLIKRLSLYSFNSESLPSNVLKQMFIYIGDVLIFQKENLRAIFNLVFTALERRTTSYS